MRMQRPANLAQRRIVGKVKLLLLSAYRSASLPQQSSTQLSVLLCGRCLSKIYFCRRATAVIIVAGSLMHSCSREQAPRPPQNQNTRADWQVDRLPQHSRIRLRISGLLATRYGCSKVSLGLVEDAHVRVLAISGPTVQSIQSRCDRCSTSDGRSR